jgi:isopentenyl-diphosphate delta-isomerase
LSGEPLSILARKDEHLDLALAQQRIAVVNAFDGIALPQCALPEVDLDEVDLATRFLNVDHALPFLVSSMTGGPARSAVINEHLATAAEVLRIPFAVGSQRVALEDVRADGLDDRLRRHAPTPSIWANFGAAQLLLGWGV